MMDWTDRHCRYFLRQLAPDIRLYTEMVTAMAIVRGNPERLLAFDRAEHPVALQIAGSDPAMLAQATRIGASFGYDEINFNLGCPSSRVQSGRFGACLMAEQELVRECVAAMCAVSPVPVSVKIRIGVDDQDGEEDLAGFVAAIAEAGCGIFIVHARKALLTGLSPKENREIPPLRYDMVHRLKERFPDLVVQLNGGISDCGAIEAHLRWTDGVMLGRKAYDDPYFLTEVQKTFFPNTEWQPPGRHEVVERMHRYGKLQMELGTSVHQVVRHMLGLYRGMPGGRAWRRFLAEKMPGDRANAGLLLDSLVVFHGLPAR